MEPRVLESRAAFLGGLDSLCLFSLKTIGDFSARSYSDLMVELASGAAAGLGLGEGEEGLPLLHGGGGEDGSLALVRGDVGDGVLLFCGFDLVNLSTSLPSCAAGGLSTMKTS